MRRWGGGWGGFFRERCHLHSSLINIRQLFLVSDNKGKKLKIEIMHTIHLYIYLYG